MHKYLIKSLNMWWLLWSLAAISMAVILYFPAELLSRIWGVWGFVLVYVVEFIICYTYMLIQKSLRKNSSVLDQALYFLEPFAIQSLILNVILLFQIMLTIIVFGLVYNV